MLRGSVLAFALVCSSAILLAQSVPTSDPQALGLAARSIAVMMGGAPVTDVTMTGTAVWMGSDSGSITLKAVGPTESRLDLVLSSGSRTEVRDSQTGNPLGKWITDKASGPVVFHNCLSDAAWFFPAFSSLNPGADRTLSYIGEETRDGANVQHLQSRLISVIGDPSSSESGRTDFYLDAETLLPAAIVFNEHPDNNQDIDLQVEIDFSNYQSVQGLMLPMHISRYRQGNLFLDITLSSVAIDTHIPLTLFSITN
jgi:hypothetical protein